MDIGIDDDMAGDNDYGVFTDEPEEESTKPTPKVAPPSSSSSSSASAPHAAVPGSKPAAKKATPASIATVKPVAPSKPKIAPPAPASQTKKPAQPPSAPAKTTTAPKPSASAKPAPNAKVAATPTDNSGAGTVSDEDEVQIVAVARPAPKKAPAKAPAKPPAKASAKAPAKSSGARVLVPATPAESAMALMQAGLGMMTQTIAQTQMAENPAMQQLLQMFQQFPQMLQAAAAASAPSQATTKKKKAPASTSKAGSSSSRFIGKADVVPGGDADQCEVADDDELEDEDDEPVLNDDKYEADDLERIFLAEADELGEQDSDKEDRFERAVPKGFREADNVDYLYLTPVLDTLAHKPQKKSASEYKVAADHGAVWMRPWQESDYLTCINLSPAALVLCCILISRDSKGRDLRSAHFKDAVGSFASAVAFRSPSQYTAVLEARVASDARYKALTCASTLLRNLLVPQATVREWMKRHSSRVDFKEASRTDNMESLFTINSDVVCADGSTVPTTEVIDALVQDDIDWNEQMLEFLYYVESCMDHSLPLLENLAVVSELVDVKKGLYTIITDPVLRLLAALFRSTEDEEVTEVDAQNRYTELHIAEEEAPSAFELAVLSVKDKRERRGNASQVRLKQLVEKYCNTEADDNNLDGEVYQPSGASDEEDDEEDDANAGSNEEDQQEGDGESSSENETLPKRASTGKMMSKIDKERKVEEVMIFESDEEDQQEQEEVPEQEPEVPSDAATHGGKKRDREEQDSPSLETEAGDGDVESGTEELPPAKRVKLDLVYEEDEEEAEKDKNEQEENEDASGEPEQEAVVEQDNEEEEEEKNDDEPEATTVFDFMPPIRDPAKRLITSMNHTENFMDDMMDVAEPNETGPELPDDQEQPDIGDEIDAGGDEEGNEESGAQEDANADTDNQDEGEEMTNAGQQADEDAMDVDQVNEEPQEQAEDGPEDGAAEQDDEQVPGQEDVDEEQPAEPETHVGDDGLPLEEDQAEDDGGNDEQAEVATEQLPEGEEAEDLAESADLAEAEVGAGDEAENEVGDGMEQGEGETDAGAEAEEEVAETELPETGCESDQMFEQEGEEGDEL